MPWRRYPELRRKRKMNSGDILRYVMVIAGVYLLGMSVISLAKRKMTEPFCLAWGFFSFLLILGGFLLRPTGLSRYISTMGLILALLIGGLVILAAYFLSRQVSDLARKNQELTMQISLLNQENERVLAVLENLTGKLKIDL